MKDIHEVLRRKQARFAQLGKQIEMLQQAAEKLREVAPLLAEIEDDDAAVLAEVDEQPAIAAKAASSSSPFPYPKLAKAKSFSASPPAASAARISRKSSTVMCRRPRFWDTSWLAPS